MIFLSGQIPLDPETMQLVEGEENQIRQVFENIDALCQKIGIQVWEIGNIVSKYKNKVNIIKS